MPHKHNGFTLIELVLVIVLLGIVATASVSYLRLGATMYADAAERERLLSQSRFALERLTRELRTALPNSVRLSADQNCIEFIPAVLIGRYEALPGVNSAAATQMTFFSVSADPDVATSRFATVYPTQPEHFYDTDSERTLAVSAQVASELVTLSFSGLAGFAKSSPNQRIFLWNSPVRYCVLPQGSRFNLYRFANYAVSENSPTTADLHPTSGVLMAEQLVNTLPPFTYTAGVLSRSSVIHLVLAFSSAFEDDLFFNQEVQIPNVP